MQLQDKRQDRRCTYKCNIKLRSCNHCCSIKAISITYSECVSVALVIQHAMHMSRIIFVSVASVCVPYFSTLSHKRHVFRKAVMEYKMRALVLSKTFVWKFPGCKNSGRYYHKCTLVFVSSTLYSRQILMKLSWHIFEKYSSINNLFYEDVQTVEEREVISC
jgi:hypothetical protein